MERDRPRVRDGLSPRIADALARHVAGLVDDLSRQGISRDGVAVWAVHPGGPNIVDAVGERLGLEEDYLEASGSVLRDFGNRSSATVLLILDRIRRDGFLADGDHLVALAFGPGLTLYAALLQQQA